MWVVLCLQIDDLLLPAVQAWLAMSTSPARRKVRRRRPRAAKKPM
jgi:hypothetical protein